MSTDQAFVEGHNLDLGYRQHHTPCYIQKGLQFQLFRGELTCLLGANGAGKSTLLRTLAGSQPALGGELLVNGHPLSNMDERERSRTIGIVLTDKTYAGGLTVYELVALGRQPHTGFFGRLHAHDKMMVRQAIEAVGMSHKSESYVSELSDGERQKIMIAKVLVQECPLILLDEPTAFLDVVSRIEIMQLLHRLAIEEQKAILLSTHDISHALTIADRLWLMNRQSGLVSGVTEDLILNGTMDRLFPSHPEISFDSRQGNYTVCLREQKPIWLETADETLFHWSRNALSRMGFHGTKEHKEPFPILTVRQADDLLLQTREDTFRFTSFEELGRFLASWPQI